jgi:hypothetical protein
MREIEQAFEALNAFGPILSIKLYRLKLDPLPAVPISPCLDHEAMLHQHVAPHAAAYLQERATGELHELTLIPDERRIEIDTVSTWEEHSAESRQRLLAMLQERLPGYRVAVKGPSGCAQSCSTRTSTRSKPRWTGCRPSAR